MKALTAGFIAVPGGSPSRVYAHRHRLAYHEVLDPDSHPKMPLAFEKVNQDVHFILQHCNLLSCYISIPHFLESVRIPGIVFLTVTCGLLLPL